MKQEISSSSSRSNSNSNLTPTLAFRQFVETCKSPATKQTYVLALHHFMKYLRLDVNDYHKLLDKNTKLIQLDVCDFITYFKRDHSSAAVSTYLAAINKFYSMNDVTLNWKKINSYQGEHVKVAEDRPYTHSEIQTLIGHATLRNRSIILLMSSAGLRLGAIPLLRIKDLEPIEKYQIYKINVYAKVTAFAYLLNDDKPIVGGPYLVYSPAAIDVYVKEIPIRMDYTEKFFQVDKMGLGFSLIKREVFDKAYVIFNKEPIFYFKSSVNPVLTGFEDMYFFDRIRKLGYRPWVDLRARLIHLKQVA
ncbi:MAG TPA: hypothetical protein VE548_07950, partial [Nitrososphaeraceae archaeon]|nr:hypothetical protein [Nitrososphaeraceae archaeon]